MEHSLRLGGPGRGRLPRLTQHSRVPLGVRRGGGAHGGSGARWGGRGPSTEGAWGVGGRGRSGRWWQQSPCPEGVRVWRTAAGRRGANHKSRPDLIFQCGLQPIVML